MVQSTRTDYRILRQNLIIDSLTKLSRLLIKDKKEIEKLPLPTLKFINLLINNPTEKVSKSTFRKFITDRSERANSLFQQTKKLHKIPSQSVIQENLNREEK